LLYKSDLSSLGYESLEPLVIVLAMGLFDSMKKIYFVKKKKKWEREKYRKAAVSGFLYLSQNFS
jgi:hypothetical protein